MQHFGGFQLFLELYITPLFGTDAIRRQLRMSKIKPNLSQLPVRIRRQNPTSLKVD